MLVSDWNVQGTGNIRCTDVVVVCVELVSVVVEVVVETVGATVGTEDGDTVGLTAVGARFGVAVGGGVKGAAVGSGVTGAVVGGGVEGAAVVLSSAVGAGVGTSDSAGIVLPGGVVETKSSQ